MEEQVVTNELLFMFRIFFLIREEMNEVGEFEEKVYEIYPFDMLN